MTATSTADAHRHHAARAWFRRHLASYAAVIGLANAINFAGGAPWWAFWPTMAWGVGLAVHFFFVKALTIDEGWVDERAAELRQHSYDYDHIRDIEKRIVERDYSVEPPSDKPPR